MRAGPRATALASTRTSASPLPSVVGSVHGGVTSARSGGTTVVTAAASITIGAITRGAFALHATSRRQGSLVHARCVARAKWFHAWIFANAPVRLKCETATRRDAVATRATRAK